MIKVPYSILKYGEIDVDEDLLLDKLLEWYYSDGFFDERVDVVDVLTALGDSIDGLLEQLPNFPKDVEITESTYDEIYDYMWDYGMKHLKCEKGLVSKI